MDKHLAAFLVLVFLSFLLVAPLMPADAGVVFTDSFSSENFNQWSRSNVTTGANQIIQSGAACFNAPSPTGGSSSYSFVVKDSFTSTPNSTIIAKQDVRLSSIPNGAQQGNSAIFFLYVCDSTNLNGNYGNVGVGIDGSSVWSLWIGGMAVYNYVFQTAGPAPVSNTWYHLVLNINNVAQTVSLEVNGIVVISASQQQFTDKTHPISLMVGMGENWWSAGPDLELDVDNVQLDISDSAGSSIPAPTSVHASTPTATRNPTPSPTQLITQTPNSTLSPLPLTPTPTAALTKPPDVTLDLTILRVTVLAVLIVLVAVSVFFKVYRVKN